MLSYRAWKTEAQGSDILHSGLLPKKEQLLLKGKVGENCFRVWSSVGHQWTWGQTITFSISLPLFLAYAIVLTVPRSFAKYYF